MCWPCTRLSRNWLALDPRQSEVVELHHFGGYTLEETARLLDVSLSTAKAEWTFAKAWLHRELSRGRHHHLIFLRLVAGSIRRRQLGEDLHIENGA